MGTFAPAGVESLRPGLPPPCAPHLPLPRARPAQSPRRSAGSSTRAEDGPIVPQVPPGDDKRELVRDPGAALETTDEPPVVARLVIEIRSDGSRTIARGALEDLTIGQRVAVKAEGTTPWSLAVALAKSIFRTPALAQKAARALLPARKKRP